MILAAGKRLNLSTISGPIDLVSVATEFNGTMPPSFERTKIFLRSSGLFLKLSLALAYTRYDLPARLKSFM